MSMPVVGSGSKLVGWVGIAAGFGIGYMVSRMFLKLGTRIGTALKSVFTAAATTGAGAVSMDWRDWAGWFIGMGIWGMIALWGWRRWKASDGFGNGLIFGIGVGGVVEEVFNIPGGI